MFFLDIPTEKVKVEQSEQPATSTGQVTNPTAMVNVPGQPQIPQLPGQPPMMGKTFCKSYIEKIRQRKKLTSFCSSDQP